MVSSLYNSIVSWTGMGTVTASAVAGMVVNGQIESGFPNNYRSCTKEMASFGAAYTISYYAKTVLENFTDRQELVAPILAGQATAAIGYAAFRGIKSVEGQEILSPREKNNIYLVSATSGLAVGGLQLAYFASAPFMLTAGATIGIGMMAAYGIAKHLTNRKVEQLAHQD